MKNLDIEKLERKNIYKTPDGFFEKMQQKVLQDVQPIPHIEAKKEGRVVKMNWVYAAAAAITMFFGITFFVNQNKTNENTFIADSAIVSNNIDLVTTTLTEDKPSEEAVALKTLEEDLTSVTPVNQKVTKPITFAAKTVEKPATQNITTVQKTNPENQVDQILANFTSAELADLGKNVEQDIYLDLYN